MLARFGCADHVINGTSGNRPGATATHAQAFFDLPADELRAVIDLNLVGAMLASRVFGWLMVQQHGSSLNLSSMATHRPLTRMVDTVRRRRHSKTSPAGWRSCWPRTFHPVCASTSSRWLLHWRAQPGTAAHRGRRPNPRWAGHHLPHLVRALRRTERFALHRDSAVAQEYLNSLRRLNRSPRIINL